MLHLSTVLQDAGFSGFSGLLGRVLSPYMLVVPRPGKIKKKYLPGLPGVSLILGKFLKNLKSGCKFFFLRGDFFSITRGRKNSVLWHFRANPTLWWGIYGKMDKLLVT